MAKPTHAEVAGKRRHLWGCKPNRPDPRDQLVMIDHDRVAQLPKATGPKQWRSQIEDQGEEGSCTGNSGTSCLELLAKKAGFPERQKSRQGLYFTTRVKIEGVDPAVDSGATIRDTQKAAVQYGVGFESTWPYDTSKFAEEPSSEYWTEAAQHKLLRYNVCPSTASVKLMLALGYPVQFGFSVTQRFTDPSFDGYLDSVGDTSIVGGHAVYTDWYDDEVKIGQDVGGFQVPNSWGLGFGLVGTPDAGCFWMSYKAYEQLAHDACCPRTEMPDQAAGLMETLKLNGVVHGLVATKLARVVTPSC